MRTFKYTLVLLWSVSSSAFADVTSLPLLSEGLHHSFETGFNIDNSRSVRSAISHYQEAATSAGMRVKPLELGWPEVEPQEGIYLLSEFEEQLESYIEQGWQPLVFVRAIDSDDITVPAYLKGSADAVSLADVDVSSPRFIQRYNALMDEVVPLIRQHGGFAIMVANEADNFLTPHPELTDDVVAFVTAARDHIHAIDSDMAVGVALSNGFDYDDDADLIRSPLPHHIALIEASDVAVFNFYCRNVPQADQAASIRQRLDARFNASNGKAIIFQEVGCPSGGAPGFSPEHQRHFFELFYGELDGTPVRLTIAFQLVDWTAATIELYGNALKPILDAEPAFRENPDLIFVYLEQLGSIGLIDASSGDPKPAWFELMNALSGD